MRRLTLPLICTTSKAANVPKPTSVAITSSRIRIAFGAPERPRGQSAVFSVGRPLVDSADQRSYD
jgi:hypothetical protein